MRINYKRMKICIRYNDLIISPRIKLRSEILFFINTTIFIFEMLKCPLIVKSVTEIIDVSST